MHISDQFLKIISQEAYVKVGTILAISVYEERVFKTLPPLYLCILRYIQSTITTLMIFMAQ